ncbi:MAG: hypothetical protein DRK00_09700, partial [Thermoprotei archaeon]
MKRRGVIKALATLLTVTIIISGMTFFAAAFTPPDPATWYALVEGVLATDNYALYPYEKDASLKVGFSKFGEIINDVENVGLEYREVDPFAPPAGSGTTPVIPKSWWWQGWFINITYTTEAGVTRNVWAAAMFADLLDPLAPDPLGIPRQYGGPWIRVDWPGDYDSTIGPYGAEDPTDPGYIQDNYAAGLKRGGRKTNGTVVTEPIKVIYDGPRKFVALLNITIYDHTAHGVETPVPDWDPVTGEGTDIPLVRILFTIIFNKVKKQIIILKDVKLIIPQKILGTGKVFIQFSNRGQVDLGVTTYDVYAHFFVEANGEGFPTVYGTSWEWGTTASPSADTRYGPEPDTEPDYFDVFQAINDVDGYVFYAAFWPSLSDWEADGWALKAKSLVSGDPHTTDLAQEPGWPFYIGEWDFELYYMPTERTQFRGVTVYGVIDWHDAKDADMGYGAKNKLDKEAGYLLDEVFNPWDLYKAFNVYEGKTTKRWVEFYEGNGIRTDFTMTYAYVKDRDDTFHYGIWDAYCSFAERVIVDEDLDGRLEPGELQVRGVDYVLKDTDGDGVYDTISFFSAPPDGALIKILYSTDAPGHGRWEWVVVGRDIKPGLDPGARTPDVVAAAYVVAALKNKGFETWYMGLDRYETGIPYVMSEKPSGYAGVGVWTAYID